LEDFFVFGLELDGSVAVLSVAVSLLGAAVSVFASDFLELLFVLFDDGLVALSAAGLLVEAGLFVVEALVVGAADAFAVALAAGVMVAATDGAGVMVAAGAGVALAFVEGAVFVVVVAPVVVVPVVVVPLVEVTPTLKLGVTP